MENYVLKVTHLEKKYHNFKVLDDVTMTIKKGAIYGLIGKNGAGKTTLIRIISGLQSPTSGEYVLYGTSHFEKGMTLSRRRMAAIIESPSIYMNMTARDNLLIQKKVCGLPTGKDIDILLELVGLKNVGVKKVKHFSLGMKQRLGIAISLASNPDFLILDEPINGLDPEGIIEMRELILKLNHEKGITILISSHYLDELSKIATDYGFLNQGKIVREVSSEKLNQFLKKKMNVKVSNSSAFVQYAEENNISYEVNPDASFTIFDNYNLSSLVLELDKRDCRIEDYTEYEESLETYYMNLLGGERK
ncbi:MAG: ATP-binding cassette domain-containing protein [Anaeroplasmataceae bacterium]|nr:ATP-binding cassette domain-containing protein [Anaeroplasmataceae bacterium]